MADSKPDLEGPTGEPAAKPGAEARSGPDLRSGVQGVAPTQFDTSERPSDAWIGRVLDDRYEVTEVLGEGGMGAVYVARHLKLHKDVALKVVRAELAGNGEVAARFAREAMATAQFEHPHVASAIDFGTLEEGGAYFVMQLVRGDSLRSVITRSGALPWRRACEIAAQVADALSAAASSGIVHRDLKPENMLVESREDGSDLVKILDFGIAHVAPTDRPAPDGALVDRQLTRVGTVMGTPGYMSPEQAVGDRVDHRTDLYALGVILWECIAGQLLWDAPSLTTVITRQMSESVPGLSQPGNDIPPQLDVLIGQLTARAATDRPERAATVREELRRLAALPQGWHPMRGLELSGMLSHPRLAAAGQSLHRLRRAAQALPSHPRVTTARQRFGALRPAARAVSVLSLAVLLLVPPWLLLRPADSESEDDDSVTLASVVDAAARVVAPAVKAVQAREVPEALEPDAEAVQHAGRTSERRAAAKNLLDHPNPSEIAPYLLSIASLEVARSCKSRREAIEAMAAAPDERFLEPLERLSRAKTTGCGFLRLGDCYKCNRADLRRALEEVRAAIE